MDPVPQPQVGQLHLARKRGRQLEYAGNWATNALPGASNIVLFNDSAAGNLDTVLAQNFAVSGALISGGIRGWPSEGLRP